MGLSPAGLVATNLVKRFGGVTAVDGVSLTVSQGEAMAVIGPNGAGKSSLLKLLAGEERPDSGTVVLDGQSLHAVSRHAVPRVGIALAHQVPRPFRSMTVRENATVAALSAGRVPAGRGIGKRAGLAVRAHVDAVLEECALIDKAGSSASDLRILDLKRLELARALATRPKVILLDEVAAGLVGRELDDVVELIRRIHSPERSIVLVEHVEGVVASLVERVMVIDWGKVITEGTPAQVAADPRVRQIYLGSSADPQHPSAQGQASTPKRSDEQPLLELHEVSAAYGSITALRHVNLRVGKGEFVGILGANGAGKSTLAGVISGQLRVAAGRLDFEGQDISRLPDYQRVARGITLCPEGRRMFAELSTTENLHVAVPLRTSITQVRRRIDAVNEVFPQLHDLRDRKAGVLSGGQQQMLAIGRALMADPKLIVCDEISLGLAPIAIDALYEALTSIRKLDVAVVLIEQAVHRSLAVVDRAYVLDRGRVSYDGDPSPLRDPHLLDRLYFGSSRAVASSI